MNHVERARAGALRVAGRLARQRRGEPEVDRRAYYREGWLDAAERLGWAAGELGSGFIRVRCPGGQVLVRGAHVGVDDIATYLLAGDKQVSGGLLRHAGLPVTDGRAFGVGDPALRRHLRERGGAMVVKPAADSGGGRGVTVGPETAGVALAAVADAAADASVVVCEERLEGRVVRALVQGGEVLDAVERAPASVTGDGRSSLARLVAVENDRRRALGAMATGFISTGPDFRAALGRAGVRPSSRPGSGRQTIVSGRSNSGSEKESRRVALPPAASEVARAAADALGVRLAGVDLCLDDADSVLAVLEVNTTPGLHWHQLVDGEPFDVFSAVLARAGE